MQVKNSSVITAVLVMLAGCDGQLTNPVQQLAKSSGTQALQQTTLKVDISTPDRAIKSYWSALDQLRTDSLNHSKVELNTFHRLQAPIEMLMTGIAFNDIKFKSRMLDTFIRDIVDVKVESESRAVLITSIKNSTPIPSGAELSKFDEKSRNEGDKYKYVLEKGESGWQVAEIWEYRTYTSTPGWSKMVPGDGKPFINTSTYEGK